MVIITHTGNRLFRISCDGSVEDARNEHFYENIYGRNCDGRCDKLGFATLFVFFELCLIICCIPYTS